VCREQELEVVLRCQEDLVLLSVLGRVGGEARRPVLAVEIPWFSLAALGAFVEEVIMEAHHVMVLHLQSLTNILVHHPKALRLQIQEERPRQDIMAVEQLRLTHQA
jgi:hypothetical protein